MLLDNFLKPSLEMLKRLSNHKFLCSLRYRISVHHSPRFPASRSRDSTADR